MADQVALKVELRSGRGKQAAKRLRASGQLPAVIYGEQDGSVACTVPSKALEGVLHTHGRNVIIALEAGDSTQSTIIKELQHHPVRGHITHVDFHRIDLTEKIVVEVAIEAQGIPAGVRNDGGILEQMLHHLEIECLPMEIPDQVVVDVSALEIGDSIHVSDITLENPSHLIVTEPERSVFSVAAPTVTPDEEEEADSAEEEEMKEPELIERGKKDDDEDES